MDGELDAVKKGESSELVVLIPGNLAVNKGYFELRKLIELSNDFNLPIKYRVLGRIEAWIEKELEPFSNVELLGRYEKQNFARHASGADLALFLSPWPETYCITFDEWKCTGRACFYYAIGALAETHRQEGLHQASVAFAIDGHEDLISALIKAATPKGLELLREPNKNSGRSTKNSSFGDKHWELFSDLLNTTRDSPPMRWPPQPQQQWVDEHKNELKPSIRKLLIRFIYRIPGGSKLAALWRHTRGR